MADIIALFDHLMDNFANIQSGVPLDDKLNKTLMKNIPAIARLSTKLLASTKVRPSGGKQKSSQYTSMTVLCMAAILEAAIAQEYRKDILKGPGGKLRRGMENIFSKFAKTEASPDEFWVDNIRVADIVGTNEPEVLEVDAVESLKSTQECLIVREKHKMQIEKIAEVMESWDFVQAHKKHQKGTIDEDFRMSLDALLHVRLQRPL